MAKVSEKKNKKERLADEIEQEELNILDEAEEAVEEEATADTLTEEQAKILELENKLDEVENRYLRMQADFENVKKDILQTVMPVRNIVRKA